LYHCIYKNSDKMTVAIIDEYYCYQL
jgi:hypothetical protein